MVKTCLDDIRGVIIVESVVGKGTTFTIRLPLTLSISKAMFCISDRARIAFPVDGFEDMVEVPQSQIILNEKGQPCLPWRDTVLPFQHLSNLLSYSRHLSRSSIYGKQENDELCIIILRNDTSYLALQVDQFLGEYEIVIKQLEGPIPQPAGIAGATVGNQQGVLLAGIAGLLAGALSMALGEWISVKSSQDLYEKQMQLEMEELETNPEGERKELKLIYLAKGIPEDEVNRIVDELMTDTKLAHSILVKEELGINAEELKGSAMEAALSSFFLFAIGAIIPVLPFFFWSGFTAIILSACFSAVGLFLIGAAITLFTGRNVLFSGTRQVIFGLAAAALTFGIGKLIGVSIAG